MTALERLENFLELTQSADPLVRKYAILSLKKIPFVPSLSQKIFHTLMRCLNDTNSEVRKATIQTMGDFLLHSEVDFHAFEKELHQEVASLLSHQDPEIRTAGVEILTALTIRDHTNGRIHGPALITKLVSLLRDPHLGVRLAVLKGMVKLVQQGASLRSAVDELLEIILQLALDKREDHHREIEFFFSQILDKAPKELWEDLLLSLNQHLDDPNKEHNLPLIQWVIRLYRPTISLSLRRELWRKLIHFGLQTENLSIESLVFQALQELALKEGWASEICEQFLSPKEKDENNLFQILFSPYKLTHQRLFAAKALGKIFAHPSAPKETLLFIQRELETNPSLELLHLVQELCSQREKASFFFATLLKLVQRHLSKEVRQEIWHTLASLPLEEKKEEIRTLFLSSLEREEPEIQIAIARALENFAKGCLKTKQVAIPILLRFALSESHPYSRIFTEILGAFYAEGNSISQEVFQTILKTLPSSKENIQENCLWLISIFSLHYPKEDLTPTFSIVARILRKSPSGFVRQTAVETLHTLYYHPSLQKYKPDILHLLILGLSDPYPLVSEAAASALENIFGKGEIYGENPS